MRLYVTGGTGFLGSNIIKVAVERHGADVFTTVHSWKPTGPAPFQYGHVDIGNRSDVLASVEAFQPDAIVHSAILNDFALMYRDRKRAWQAYVEATRLLTEAANRVGAKMVLVSTDWVFDGTQSNADETTPPNPINYYGVLKVVCETVVQETAQNGAVARVAGVNGMHWARPDDERPQNLGFGHFCTAVVETLRKGDTFRVWEGAINMVATPSLASESAEMLLRIVEQDQRGVFHCCGGEQIGRRALARLTAEVFELDEQRVEPGPPEEDQPAGIAIPYDTSLSAAATGERLGYRLPTVRELLRRYRAEVETGALWSNQSV
jgi:dTDP-4-dehydrorhamnose reductase